VAHQPNRTNDERDKKQEDATIIPLAHLKFVFAGAYALSGLLFIFSYLTRPAVPYTQSVDPYFYYAMLLGVSTAVLSLIYAIMNLAMSRRLTQTKS